MIKPIDLSGMLYDQRQLLNSTIAARTTYVDDVAWGYGLHILRCCREHQFDIAEIVLDVEYSIWEGLLREELQQLRGKLGEDR